MNNRLCNSAEYYFINFCFLPRIVSKDQFPVLEKTKAIHYGPDSERWFKPRFS